MSDSRGGCQLAAVPWSASRLADARVTGLRTSLLDCVSRAAKAAVGEYTADTGPPGDRPCPAGPRDGLPRQAQRGSSPGASLWAAEPGTARLALTACSGVFTAWSGAFGALELRG